MQPNDIDTKSVHGLAHHSKTNLRQSNSKHLIFIAMIQLIVDIVYLYGKYFSILFSTKRSFYKTNAYFVFANSAVKIIDTSFSIEIIQKLQLLQSNHNFRFKEYWLSKFVCFFSRFIAMNLKRDNTHAKCHTVLGYLVARLVLPLQKSHHLLRMLQ